VRVPKSVIAMIADLRSHLQENLEPPVYVSDRRLVKAIAMLQASALITCPLSPRDAAELAQHSGRHHRRWSRPKVHCLGCNMHLPLILCFDSLRED